MHQSKLFDQKPLNNWIYLNLNLFQHFFSFELFFFLFNRCQEKCKAGYVHDPENGKCVPNCDGGCLNGRCVEPNKCVCNPRYTITDRSKPNECQCEMYCAEIDEKCECLHKDKRISGLQIHNDTLSFCNATKSMNETASTNETFSYSCGCLNGFSSNGACVCARGYKLLEGFADLCVPDCDDECIGGTCVEPNQCLCEIGHECTASALTNNRQKAGINWYGFYFESHIFESNSSIIC